MKVESTEHRFSRVEFTDRNGTTCSLQKSSVATDDLIWLGCNDIGLKRFEPGIGWTDVVLEGEPYGIKHIANTRMHLGQDRVKDLITLLQRFVDTGELYEQRIDPTRAEALADLDKTIDELIDAEDKLRAEAERPKVEWRLNPDEQAWWWHWNGEDYAVPHVYSVLVSNTGGPRYFVSFPDCRWCDEMGGFWLKVQYPNVPSREDQSEMKASRVTQKGDSKNSS